MEVNTHQPGALGALVGKRVYTYSSATSGTPSGSNDHTYAYDAVGNTIAVYNANTSGRGNELYYFSQDAFGNELSDDLDGELRPIDIPGKGRNGEGAFDMGAFEFQLEEAPTPTPIPTIQNERTDIDQSGKVDTEDLLLLLQDWGRVSGPSGD